MFDQLGQPDSVAQSPKGSVETWRISRHPLSSVTIRSFSKPGRPTIDVNKVEGMEGVRRYAVDEEAE